MPLMSTKRPQSHLLLLEELVPWSVLAFVGHLITRSTRAPNQCTKKAFHHSHLPILWTTQSCWQRGQRLFCFTHRDMQQLWKEWLHSPQTTERRKEKKKRLSDITYFKLNYWTQIIGYFILWQIIMVRYLEARWLIGQHFFYLWRNKNLPV